jgi:hypothetical protein
MQQEEENARLYQGDERRPWSSRVRQMPKRRAAPRKPLSRTMVDVYSQCRTGTLYPYVRLSDVPS